MFHSKHNSPLQQALQEFKSTIEDPKTRPNDFQKPIEGIWLAASQMEDGPDTALQFLEPFLREPHIGIAGFTALCCGGLIEAGGNPAITLHSLMSRVPGLLANCESFIRRCFQLDGRDFDPVFAFEVIEQRGREVFEQNQELAGSWSMLDLFGRACVAHLIPSKEGRKRYRNDASLMDPLQRLSEVHEWAGWMHKLLAILDDEVLIVIQPGSLHGYRVQIAGIVDNFQLHTLLADALMGDPSQGWLEGNKPEKEIVALAKGEQIETEEYPAAHGIFNMVGWRGLRPDLTLSDDHNHWIWGEGTPSEIEPFNSTRIVLLGVCPYERSWNTEPTFRGLQAEVKVLEQLNTQSVQQWLQKIAGTSP